MELEKLFEDWKKVIEFAKEHPFCEIKLVLRNGKPTYGYQIIEEVKFN